MGYLGNISLIAVFSLSIYTIFAAVLGVKTRRNDLIVSAERSVMATFFATCITFISLSIILAKSDFHYEYIYSYSNLALPIFYKISGLWAGQAGSLLLWLLILSGFTAFATYLYRDRDRELMPWAMVVFACTTLFFAYVVLFLSNPFRELVMGNGINMPVDYFPPDGKGLNPLLQHPAMVIHPPILFAGYSGFIVPFGFALAALITGQLDSSWIKSTRRWTIFSWLLLTAGILLGAKWAYVELGWGGYWAWDPVENASLMPWLTGTAFLHSVMIQEKRGMLKVWNMSLIILTFALCIFGTFITRSGLISSVHSFASSTIGPAFLAFLVFILAVSGFLLIRRLPDLKSENRLDSLLSRESSFLFNNLLLLGALFATFWGTIFPVISEAVTGNKITVGAPFFNKVNVPIGLMLMMLTGLGPLFAWRKTSTYSLKHNFILPTIGALAFTSVLFAFGIHAVMPLISFYLCIFVTITIIQEFSKSANARMKNWNESFVTALVGTTMRNTRRYGGYIVHFGMVLLFVGFTGSAFVTENTSDLLTGESLEVGDYSVTVADISQGGNDLYDYQQVILEIKKDGVLIGHKQTQRRVYHASEQTTTELAIHSTMMEDLYLVFSGMNSNNRAVIHVYLNPLVMFVWLGSVVLCIGTVIAMIPSQREKKATGTKAKSKSENVVA